jgi:hypothetical protein
VIPVKDSMKLLSFEDSLKAEMDLLLYGNTFVSITFNAETGKQSAKRIEPLDVVLTKEKK